MEKLGDVRRMIRVREVKLREGREREREISAGGERQQQCMGGGWSEVNFVDVRLSSRTSVWLKTSELATPPPWTGVKRTCVTLTDADALDST